MIVVLKLIIALSLLNVWVVRFDKESPFRGADSNSMIEEFKFTDFLKYLCILLVFTKFFSLFLIFSLFWI